MNVETLSIYDVRCALRLGYTNLRSVSTAAAPAVMARLEALEARKDELEATLRGQNTKQFHVSIPDHPRTPRTFGATR